MPQKALRPFPGPGHPKQKRSKRSGTREPPRIAENATEPRRPMIMPLRIASNGKKTKTPNRCRPKGGQRRKKKCNRVDTSVTGLRRRYEARRSSGGANQEPQRGHQKAKGELHVTIAEKPGGEVILGAPGKKQGRGRKKGGKREDAKKSGQKKGPSLRFLTTNTGVGKGDTATTDTCNPAKKNSPGALPTETPVLLEKHKNPKFQGSPEESVQREKIVLNKYKNSSIANPNQEALAEKKTP